MGKGKEDGPVGEEEVGDGEPRVRKNFVQTTKGAAKGAREKGKEARAMAGQESLARIIFSWGMEAVLTGGKRGGVGRR